MSLPVELRCMIYKYLFSAWGKRKLKRASARLRHIEVDNLGDGRIIFSKLDNEGAISKPHARSALPGIQVLRACKGINLEAPGEMYIVNTFEVTARTPYRTGEDIFHLPKSVQLDKIRYLTLVTDTDVSRFQSCFTYEILRSMEKLRTLSVAMKTAFVGGGPDFNSALETLNLLVWVPEYVELKFGIEGDLMHHDHPTWVCSAVLQMYVEIFNDLRGAALGTWTMDVTVAYSKALAMAQGFVVL
jgi:hypothetical protein